MGRRTSPGGVLRGRRLFRFRVAAGVAVALAVAGLAAWRFGAGTPSPEARAVAGLSAEQAVALANAWAAEGRKVESSITTEALYLRWPDGQQVTVPLPPDRVYLAVAPYVEHTHPCRNHVLSSCRGELPGKRFEVVARTADGATIFEGTVTTLPNGFFELWLPRGLDLTLTVRSPELGRQGSGAISTRDGAPTCITTVQLT